MTRLDISMRKRKKATAIIIAKKLVNPAEVALRGVRSGMVSMQDAINLRMIGRLAQKAVMRGLCVPDITPQMDVIVDSIITGLKGDGHAVLDQDALDQAEQALMRLRNHFAKISTFTLSAFIDDLVLTCEIRDAARLMAD